MLIFRDGPIGSLIIDSVYHLFMYYTFSLINQNKVFLKKDCTAL